MKIVEVNSEMEDEEDQRDEDGGISDSHNTQMSFGEVDAELDRGGPSGNISGDGPADQEEQR